jgi:NADPH:quinone reductase-like Zn-dependent oxidoreductase
VQTGNGGPEVLTLQSVPVLQPGEKQVLIRVYAAAVNPTDWKMRIGPSPGSAVRRRRCHA